MQNSIGVSPYSLSMGKLGVLRPEKKSSIGVESTMEKLKEEIHEKFYPSSIRTPIVPKRIFPLSDMKSFVLLSTHGEACYLSLDDPNPVSAPKIDLTGMIKNEVRNMTQVSDDQYYYGDTYGILMKINLKTEIYEDLRVLGNIKTLDQVSKTLYILESEALKVLKDNSLTEFPQFWQESPVDISVKTDQSILALSTEGSYIYILDISSETVLEKLESESPCSVVKITNSYLFGMNEESLLIWDLNWKLVCKKRSNSHKFTCLDINTTESYVALGCKDGTVYVWSLNELNLLPSKYIGCSYNIEKIRFVSDFDIIYYSSEKNKMMFITLKHNQNEFETDLPQDNIVEIVVPKSSDHIVVKSLDNGLYIYDARNLEFKSHVYKNQEVIISVNGDSLNTTYNDNESKKNFCTCFSLSKFSEKGKIELYETDGPWWVNVQASRETNKDILLGGANGIMTILREELDAIVRDCKVHENQITAIACAKSGDFSISGDLNGNIIMFDLNIYTSLARLRRHNASVSALSISNDDLWLVSGSIDGMIRVFSLLNKTCINTIRYYDTQISTILISKDLGHFFVNTKDNKFAIWNMNSHTLVTSSDRVNAFGLDDNEITLYLAVDGALQALENPLTTKSLSVAGQGHEKQQIFKYFYKILKNQYPTYRPEYNNWLISPYLMNPLHLYAYINLSKHLKMALKDDICFIEDRKRNSALSTLVKNESLLVNDVVEFLVKKMDKFKGISYFLENTIASMTGIGSENLKDLYEKLFQRIYNSQLPEFCEKSVKLPIFIETNNSYNVQVEEFFGKNRVSMEKAIEFKQFPIKMNFETGSSESLYFLENLLKCPNKSIYRTEFVKLFLDYKWGQAKWVFIAQAILYFLYLFLLILYIALEFDTSSLYLLVVLSSIILSYEFFQLIGMRSRYFKDKRNLLDLARAILLYIYLGLDPQSSLIIFVIIISFIRGINYFDIFGPTRYMSYLIKEVLKDIFSFIILFCYSIIAISCIFSAVDSGQERGTIIYYLETTYYMSLGNLDYEDFSQTERILFVFASIINLVIMLNLLISILGDTFDRVQQEIVEADRKAVLQMILEVEYLFFWKRTYSKKAYFTACTESKISEIYQDKWEGKIRAIMSKIDSTKHHVSLIPSQVEAIVQNENKKLLAGLKAIIQGNIEEEEHMHPILKEQSSKGLK